MQEDPEIEKTLLRNLKKRERERQQHFEREISAVGSTDMTENQRTMFDYARPS